MKKFLIAGTMLGVILSSAAVAQADDAARKQSSFGVYTGYAKPVYDGFVRTSQYVTVRDGTRLAVDIYRPTRNGDLSKEKLPIVWTFTPYNRATRDDQGVVTPSEASQLSLLHYGYNVVIADVRGKGASFGVRNGPADANETNDAHDITEWLAAQPWTNGRIGMTGCSYYGSTALQAARSGAPHLKAVFAGTTMFDQYGTFAAGGIASAGLLDDSVSASAVAEVDADKDRSLVTQALAEHAANTKTGTFFASTPFRDDINPYTSTRWWEVGSFYPYLNKIRDDVGIYVYGGYNDVYADQTVLKFNNIRGNKKLAFGDWIHCETPGFRMDNERLRFFDHWLKGIENGVMTEDPINVFVTRAQDGTEWRALKQWPDQPRTRYYLSSQEPPANPSHRGNQTSMVNGALQSAALGADATPVILRDVPPAQTLVIYGTVRGSVDPHSATFTLPPQADWKEVIGSPVAHLWVSTPAPDADLYVYLEHVNRLGGVQVISRGKLRASHRKTGKAPYDTGSLPWHTHRRADHQPLTPGQPVSLDIPLSPVAYTFRKGDLLRLAVTTRPPSDRSDTSPTPLTILSDAAHPSWIEVPEFDTAGPAVKAGKVSMPGSYHTPETRK